jgi:NAD(P)-dependent dehydrogenase (short-subunit alcohol dehydrogenase family)
MAGAQKTAIVTGASQGVGEALVEAFLKRGYSIVDGGAHAGIW